MNLPLRKPSVGTQGLPHILLPKLGPRGTTPLPTAAPCKVAASHSLGREARKCDILLIIAKINCGLRLAAAKPKCENPTLLVRKTSPRELKISPQQHRVREEAEESADVSSI